MKHLWKTASVQPSNGFIHKYESMSNDIPESDFSQDLKELGTGIEQEQTQVPRSQETTEVSNVHNLDEYPIKTQLVSSSDGTFYEVSYATIIAGKLNFETDAIAFDSNNNLYILEKGNLKIIDLNGKTEKNVKIDSNSSDKITVNPKNNKVYFGGAVGGFYMYDPANPNRVDKLFDLKSETIISRIMFDGNDNIYLRLTRDLNMYLSKYDTRNEVYSSTPYYSAHPTAADSPQKIKEEDKEMFEKITAKEPSLRIQMNNTFYSVIMEKDNVYLGQPSGEKISILGGYDVEGVLLYDKEISAIQSPIISPQGHIYTVAATNDDDWDTSSLIQIKLNPIDSAPSTSTTQKETEIQLTSFPTETRIIPINDSVSYKMTYEMIGGEKVHEWFATPPITISKEPLVFPKLKSRIKGDVSHKIIMPNHKLNETLGKYTRRTVERNTLKLTWKFRQINGKNTWKAYGEWVEPYETTSKYDEKGLRIKIGPEDYTVDEDGNVTINPDVFLEMPPTSIKKKTSSLPETEAKANDSNKITPQQENEILSEFHSFVSKWGLYSLPGPTPGIEEFVDEFLEFIGEHEATLSDKIEKKERTFEEKKKAIKDFIDRFRQRQKK